MSVLRQRILQASLWLLESRIFWGILLAGLFLANAIWCSRNRLAGDVAWYLYAIKRLQSGAVLYRDIHDMNPPVVYMMYLPLGWLNQLTGWRIDWLLYGALAAGSAAGAGWVWKIPGVGFAVRGILALTVAFAGLSLNRFQLGQRDPICGLLFAGLAISAYLRIERRDEDPGWISWAGVLVASLGMAMKPHFLAPWALVVALMAWRLGVVPVARMKEFWMPLAVSTLAWVVTFIAFPDFRTMVALAYRYYSNANVSFYEFSPLLVPLIVVLVALLRKTEAPLRTLLEISALSTAGFMVACVAQRKGFPYHIAPPMYWAAMTMGVLLADTFERTTAKALWRVSAMTAGLMVLLPAYSLWSATAPPPAVFVPTEVEAFVSQHARGKTVLTLSTDLRTGFPLILEAGAVNARPDAQLWMLGQMYRDQVVQAELSAEPVAARYHLRAEMDDEELHNFDEAVDLLVRKRPAVILVQIAQRKWGLDNLQFDFIEYFSQDQRFVEALKHYKPGPVSDQRVVLVRDDATLVAGEVAGEVR